MKTNERILLIPASAERGADIMTYRQEFLDAGDSMDGTSGLRDFDRIEPWLQQVEGYSDPARCPADKVPSDTYLAVRESDGRMVGMIDVRRHLNNPILSVWGGNIGYSVRPSERRRGYATEMLRLALIRCRELGIDRALVTCDRTNDASRRTILANGGVYERDVIVDGEPVCRFWIPTSPEGK